MTSKLAKIPEPGHQYKVGARVITLELAQRFAETLISDPTHSVHSASHDAGINPNAVRQALWRYDHDKCRTLEDEEICQVLAEAKARHIKALRHAGFVCAARDNRSGTSWVQWQLEVQAPLEFPRKNDKVADAPEDERSALETSKAPRYVIHVPPDEEDV